MIIRRLGTSVQLITQPQHAELAAFIITNWCPDHFSIITTQGIDFARY